MEEYYEARIIPINNETILAISRNITQRKRLEKALEAEKRLLETTLVSVGDGVISTDIEGNIVFLNYMAEILTGWSQPEAKGEAFEKVFRMVNEFTREPCENIVEKALQMGKIEELENHTILISKQGTERPIENSAAPIMQNDGSMSGVVLVFRDFSQQKVKQEKIKYLSYHDQLTGLYNRRYYEEKLLRIDHKSNLPMSIAVMDVNGLKLMNDAFGHTAGDALLKKVAEISENECRNGDLAARIGGDEFVVILPKTEKEKAEKVVDRIVEKLSLEEVSSVPISLSAGVAAKSSLRQNLSDVYAEAEERMYKIKLSKSRAMRYETFWKIMETLNAMNVIERAHAENVSRLCGEIGAALNLNREKLDELKTLGQVHDIGMIVVGERIHEKVEPLTQAEYAELKRHPEVGYQILRSVNEYAPMAEDVLAHHERWDGGGYPHGLKEKEIPLSARILTLADAYDAMTHDRPYRKRLSPAEAAEELKNQSGRQFDPELVEIFFKKVINNHNNQGNSL